MSPDPDALLMMDFQKGNPSSFEALMRKYYTRLYRFAYRMTGRHQSAEDAAQETFVRVYQAAAGYRPEAKFQTWLYAIARNTCLKILRRDRRYIALGEEGGAVMDAVTFASDAEESPLQRMETEERARWVRCAVQALPEAQRSVVILFRYEGLSYEEIAGVMGCSVGAVKSLLHRARRSLAETLRRGDGA